MFKLVVFISLIITLVLTQQAPGTAQAGDNCQKNMDCANSAMGACCLKASNQCSSDNGMFDASGARITRDDCKTDDMHDHDHGNKDGKGGPDGMKDPKGANGNGGNNLWWWIGGVAGAGVAVAAGVGIGVGSYFLIDQFVLNSA